MARQVLTVPSSLDRAGYQLVVDFYTGAYSADAIDEVHPGLRYATEVVRVLGPQYSYAFIGVPVDTFGEEWAPAVALQRTGPAGRVKLRSRAKVKMIDYDGSEIPLMVGYVTQYAHSIDEDSVVSMVMDDRWLLSKVTAFGSAVYDPVAKLSYFDAGRPLVFCAQGYPDCIDSPAGPRFAPGRLFGYKKSNAVEDKNEPAFGQAQTRARSWTCGDVLRYLRDMYYAGLRPPHPQKYGKQQVSQFIDWPDSLGNQTGFNRPVRDFKLENIEVGECIARTCKKAGPYEIQMDPVGWRGRIGIVQINSRRGGSYLVGPRYGSTADGGSIENCLADPTRIAGGTVMESIVGYFDDVCIAGDPPAVEHQFSEADPDDGAIPVELEPAWEASEETNLKAIIDANGNDADALAMAFRAEPRVYAAWKVKEGYAAHEQTQWAEWPQPNNPRILAHLLSGYAQGNNNPRDWNPRETVLEYYNTDDAEWQPCSRFDDLTIIDEGKAFIVEGLRTSSDPVTWKGDPATTSGMGANKMRITCAVEREFRIVGTAQGDPNNTSARVNNAGESFTFLAVAEDGDYSHWERYHSRPNGNAVSEPELSQKFPDASKGSPDPTTGETFLFSDLLDETSSSSGRAGSAQVRISRHAEHRLEDVKRIDYNGVLTMHTWNPGIKPGMQVIVDLGGNSLNPKAIIKSVKFNSMTQSQEIELMSGDNSVIYDVPLPVPTQTSGGAPVPTGSANASPSPNMGTSDAVQKMQTASDITTTTSTANRSTETSGGATSGNPTTPAQQSTETPEQAQKRTDRDIAWGLAQRERNAAWDRKDAAEETRVKSSVRTGGQMSAGPSEGDYTPEAAQRRRDAKEAGLVEKALRRSVQTERERQEEE